MKDFKPEKQITDYHSFNEYTCEMLEVFLESMQGKREFLRLVDKDNDDVPEEWEFMYTNRAMRLINRFKERVMKVGFARYDEDDVEEPSSYLLTDY
jgi:hypothetical protein